MHHKELGSPLLSILHCLPIQIISYSSFADDKSFEAFLTHIFLNQTTDLLYNQPLQMSHRTEKIMTNHFTGFVSLTCDGCFILLAIAATNMD